jgi:hypothetical protein
MVGVGALTSKAPVEGVKEVPMRSIRARLLVCALFAASLASSACTTRIGDFSMMSTGTPQYAAIDKAPIKRTVEASDGRLWFLFIPLGGAPNLEEAVDRVMDEGNGDFLERVRLYSKHWTIGLFSYGAYSVIADVGDSRHGQAMTHHQ